MIPDELKAKMAAHRLWIADPSQGSRADLRNEDLRHADLRHVNLSGADLTEAILTGANFSGANLTGVILTWACLSGADLTEACLIRACLIMADLRWAILRGADLRGACLRGADLTDADLLGVKLGTHTVGEGRHATFALNYWAMTTRDAKGQRWLQYGCESLTLDDWDRSAGELAKKHHPKESARYEAETRALVALCRTLDTEEGAQ